MNKADPNAQSRTGATPLHSSAYHGHVDIMEALSKYDVNLLAHENDGYTALHFAAQEGHQSAVQWLLKQEKKLISEIDDDGYTPLHFAAQEGHLEIVKLLVEGGADVNACVHLRGELPYCFGLWGDCLEVEREESESTPLHSSVERGHEKIVSFLLAQGADPNAQTSLGNTALHLAAEKNHVVVIENLLSHEKVDRHIYTKNGLNALHLAAVKGIGVLLKNCWHLDTKLILQKKQPKRRVSTLLQNEDTLM